MLRSPSGTARLSLTLVHKWSQMAQGHLSGWVGEGQAKGQAVLREQDPGTCIRGCVIEQWTNEQGRWRRSCQRWERL